MKFIPIFGCIALAMLCPSGASAAPQIYSYVVSNRMYGVIGVYDRTVDEADGVLRADSRLRVAVKVLGVTVHRENADQTEVWRGERLMSFDSVATINGRPLNVRGHASDNRFLIISPSGTKAAPAEIAASDPLSLNRLGPALVVSLKTGQVDPVQVTGGEAETIRLRGVATPVRHFHVNTAARPNKWEVWFDQDGVPVKFRSAEPGGAVDFTLASPPPKVPEAPARLALGRSSPTLDAQ
jgi:hypothetical protein